MSLFLVFGSTLLCPVKEVICHLIKNETDYEVSVLSSIDCFKMNYEDTSCELEEVMGKLSTGDICSIHILKKINEKFIINIMAPNFCGEPLKKWLCAIEGEPFDKESLFEYCIKKDGVEFVLICMDEFPDFGKRQMNRIFR